MNIDETLQKIIDEANTLSYGRHFKKYTRHRTRIKEAMFCEEQGKTMRDCYDNIGPACGSIFCDKCLDKRQRNLYHTYRQYYENNLGKNEAKARKQLRWITILHSLVRVKFDTMEDENKSVAACVDAANEIKHQIRNLSRGKKLLWLRGAIHAELIDYSLFEEFVKTGGGTIKQKTLDAFIKKLGVSHSKEGLFSKVITGTDKELYFLVHFHALADIGDTDVKDIRKVLTDKWSLTNRQVDISSLWEVVRDKEGKESAHSIDDALKGMARYCFSRSNPELTFSENWGSGERIHIIEKRIDLKLGTRTIAVMSKHRDIDKETSLSTGEVRILVKTHNAISGPNNDGLNVSIYKKV